MTNKQKMATFASILSAGPPHQTQSWKASAAKTATVLTRVHPHPHVCVTLCQIVDASCSNKASCHTIGQPEMRVRILAETHGVVCLYANVLWHTLLLLKDALHHVCTMADSFIISNVHPSPPSMRQDRCQHHLGASKTFQLIRQSVKLVVLRIAPFGFVHVVCNHHQRTKVFWVGWPTPGQRQPSTGAANWPSHWSKDLPRPTWMSIVTH